MTVQRRATVLIGEDRIVIHSANVEQILTEVGMAMADSRLVPPPTDLKALIQPLLKATGEKTGHAVCRSFAYIGVSEEKDDGLVFFSGFPVKGGFLYRTEAHWRCKRSSRADMAAAFRAAAAVAIEEQNLHNRPQLP
jgi:hypothetical protein